MNVLTGLIASNSGGNPPAGDEPMLSYVVIAGIPQQTSASVQFTVGHVEGRVCRVDVCISLQRHGGKPRYFHMYLAMSYVCMYCLTICGRRI